MASKTRRKIFLKNGSDILNFMWADVTSDGSVVMGLYGVSFKPSIEKIFEKEGEVLPGQGFEDVSGGQLTNDTKITFHTSGFYKLKNEIKKITRDRVTIKGTPLGEIAEPMRMLEILIPARLTKALKKPNEDMDITVDITTFPAKPMRCTVMCMPSEMADAVGDAKVVDTSIIETTIRLDSGTKSWIWTIRVSKDDTLQHDNKYFVFIPGEVVSPK